MCHLRAHVGAVVLRRCLSVTLAFSDQLLAEAVLSCYIILFQHFLHAQVFKIKYVAPYSEQLHKLAADQTLREAMAGFALGPGAGAGIAPQHRSGMSTYLWLLLFQRPCLLRVLV